MKKHYLEIELDKNPSSLKDLKELIYSKYLNSITGSDELYEYEVEKLGAGYEATTQGVFNSELITPITHKRCYQDNGTRGAFHYYVNTFSIDNANFEINEKFPAVNVKM